MNNEPVAWMLTLPDGTHDWILDGNECEGYIPLYTHPTNLTEIIEKNKPEIEKVNDYIKLLEEEIQVLKAKTLTDEEIWDWFKENTALEKESALKIARAILRKAQEK